VAGFFPKYENLSGLINLKISKRNSGFKRALSLSRSFKNKLSFYQPSRNEKMSHFTGRTLYTKSLPPIPDQANNRPISNVSEKPPTSLWRNHIKSSEAHLKIENEIKDQRIKFIEHINQQQLRQLEKLSTELYNIRKSYKFYKLFQNHTLDNIQRIGSLVDILIKAEEEYKIALDKLATTYSSKTKEVREEIKNFEELFSREEEAKVVEGNNISEDLEDIYIEEDYTDEEVIEGKGLEKIEIGFNII